MWTDPESGSQIEFDSFAHMARTAERGLFDFFFLAEGLRLREHRGQIYDLDVVGRPDTFTVLAALAAVTDRLGLTGTINTTFNEPFEVARQFATLDQLSDGRAGWNIVTSSDAFTGANFRRGGFLDHAGPLPAGRGIPQRDTRILGQLGIGCRAAPTSMSANLSRSRPGGGGRASRPTSSTCAEWRRCPAGPQGHPILLQAGDSDEGRNFGAHYADALFTLHGSLEDGQRYYADVKGRAASYGRNPNELKVFPAATFVLGDTADEADDKAHYIRRQQVSGPTAIAMLEQVWGRDLSEYDPDGPLPEDDPTGDTSITQGRVRHGDPIEVARRYRERAEAENLSIRELIIAVTSREQFVGTAEHVAAEIDRYIQADACDGFILVPHLTPHGLDEFVDHVVPLLQERSGFRTEYSGTTLREHLGLTQRRDRRSARYWTFARSVDLDRRPL